MTRSRLKNKYSRPKHPWQISRIREEADLRKIYGYKNKREIWKMESILRNFRAQARRLIPLTHKQAQIERAQLLGRLYRLGLISKDAHIEDVLALTIKDILERRLQTIVYKKGMANTIKQARQMITHGHVVIGEKKVKSPSHLVSMEEEGMVKFAPNSPFINEMHPERVAIQKKKEKEIQKKKEKEIKSENVEGEESGGKEN